MLHHRVALRVKWKENLAYDKLPHYYRSYQSLIIITSLKHYNLEIKLLQININMQLSLSFQKYTQVWQIKFHPHNVYNSSLQLTDRHLSGRRSSLRLFENMRMVSSRTGQTEAELENTFLKDGIKRDTVGGDGIKRSLHLQVYILKRWREHIPLEFEFQSVVTTSSTFKTDWLGRQSNSHMRPQPTEGWKLLENSNGERLLGVREFKAACSRWWANTKICRYQWEDWQTENE